MEFQQEQAYRLPSGTPLLSLRGAIVQKSDEAIS
jgi:hypothetical protein